MKFKSFSVLTGLIILTAFCAIPAVAQNKAPDQIPGEAVYIPFPVTITLDGKLDDWAGIPVQKVSTGTMKSPDPKQNQFFEFSVAADATNLYVYMHSVDSNIIAGKHAKDFWNEDSMEFYVNYTGKLGMTAYSTGMMQVNINATNIGKKAGDVLSIIGTNSEKSKVTANVFKTADGWAFEAAIPLVACVPEHGKIIGFQIQANGATAANRDSKLIWGKKDTTDASYQNPSLFGKGIFFKVGSTDVPPATKK